MCKNQERFVASVGRYNQKPWSLGCSNYLKNTKQTSTFRAKALRWEIRQLSTNAGPSLETSKFALYFSGSLNNLTTNQAF